MLVITTFLVAFPGSSRAKGVPTNNTTYAGWCVGGFLGGYGMILHTTDGCGTWTRQGTPQSVPNVVFESVAALDVNNCWVVGGPIDGYGTILRTTDGGNTWVRQGSTASIPNVGLLKISAVDINTAWVVGDPGVVLFTNDGGQTWTSKNAGAIPDIHLQGVYAIDSDNAWVTGDPVDGYGTIFRTTDGGATWQRKGSAAQVPATSLLNVHAVDQDTAWIAAQGNHEFPQSSVIQTTNNGQSWEGQILGSPWFDTNDVTTVGKNIVWVVTDADGIYRTDNGKDFVQQTAAKTDDDYYLLCVDALDSQTAWICGSSGVGHGIIEHTADGGKNWEAQTEADTGLYGVSFAKIFTVTASITGGHGTVTPATQTVTQGANATVNINPGAGYHTASVKDNGATATHTPTDQYTVNNVSANHDVLVTFASDSSTWYLAEGSTAWGFSTYVTIENPNEEELHARLTYMNPNPTSGTGVVGSKTVALPASSQTVVNPAEQVGKQDFSTKVECLEGKPIAVDRTMTWTGPGAASPEAHCSVGVTDPSTTWFLPEGSSAWDFETWLLLQNPNPDTAKVEITYMTEGGASQTFRKSVPANSRATFNMADDIGANDASIKVASDRGIIVERSMYRNNRREGSSSIGTTTPATDYYLAEGTTAWGFTTYVLVQNPNDSATDVSLTYMTQSGQVPGPSFQMPANSRKTIKVNDVAGMANTDFSTQVHGTKPIIAERSMYWGADTPLGEACHDSIGMDSAHTTFYLPDGQTSDGRETYTLVQNPNGTDVTVDVTYMTPNGTGNVTKTETIGANSRRTFNMAEHSGLNGRAAIMVKCMTSGKKVMVERAMYWNNRGAGTDTIGGCGE